MCWTYLFKYAIWHQKYVFRLKITHWRLFAMFQIVLRPLVWVFWDIRAQNPSSCVELWVFMKQPVRFTIQIFLRNTRKRPKLTRILLTLMFQIVLRPIFWVFWDIRAQNPHFSYNTYLPWERPYQNLGVSSTSSVQLCCEWICTQIRPMG